MKKNHTKRYNLNVLSCALAACLVMAAPAYAQSTAATLRGQSPAGARITVTNVDTGLTRSVEAGATGSYTIPGLPPGTYRIDGASGGSRNVTLAVGQVATVNLTQAAPATSADGVTTLDRVVATAEFVPETKTSEVATYVSSKQIEMLPQNSRNFLAFADVVPGMYFSNDSGQEAQLRSGAQGTSQINVFIDGVGQKNYVTPGGLTGQDDSEGNPFPQLAMGEYKVITSNYKAEYDQISSAAVVAVTRSGTNTFHGNVFWDKTSDAWRKSTPAEKVAGSKSESKVEQYGFALGGPIVRDRLHFFVAYEGKDIMRPALIAQPTSVPAGALPTSITSQYGLTSRPFNEDLYFAKLSWQASEDHLIELSGKYRKEAGILGVGGVSLPSYATKLSNPETRIDLRSLYTSVDWMNEAHITYESATYNPRPETPGPSARYTVRNQTNNGDITVLNTGGGPNFQDKGQKGWGLQDDFTWYGWDGHTVKAGFKFKQVDLKAFQQFPPYPLYLYDVNESMTQPYRVQYTTARVGRDPFVSSSNKQYGLYIQDDWEVNERLTVNMGLRWDYEAIPSYTDFVPAAGIVSALRGWANIQNTDYNIEDYINDGHKRKDDKNNFAPRIGFSYDLTGDQRHVIFGGAGRSYDRNLFDYMAREYYGGAFTTYTLNFPTPLHGCSGSNCIAFDPALMTEQGLAAWAAAHPTAGGEVNLLANDLKTPYSDQYSIGIRDTFTVAGNDWRSSVAISRILYKDGFYSRLGNRWANGSFRNPAVPDATWGNQPWGQAIPGYGSLILGDNGIENRLTSLLVSLEKPYSDASPWGFTVAYTYSDAKENRTNSSNGETYVFDYPSVGDTFYTSNGVPKHRLVASGIASVPWDILLTGKLTLASPKPRNATNCFDVPNTNQCFYDPYTPNGTIGFKQLDLAAEKRFAFGDRYALKIRADVLNVFNWTNWSGYDDWRGGPGSANANFGKQVGVGIIDPTRTFKLTVGFDW